MPLSGGALNGVDALYSTVQMPKGIPVATVAIDGAMNAALLVVQMLAIDDADLAKALAEHRVEMAPPRLTAEVRGPRPVVGPTSVGGRLGRGTRAPARRPRAGPGVRPSRRR